MSSFESLYRETEDNVKQAIKRFSELKSRYESVLKENENLRAELVESKRKLENTEEKLKLVQLSKTITDEKEKKELKKLIDELVREIDNSIKLIGGR